MKRISNILNDKMKPMWRLTLACLTFFALAGNALAQGNDGLFVIKKTKYNPAPGTEDHYLAHVRVGDNYVLQDATSFSPDCLWYSGREYNLMGTNHNYYFIDHLGEPRFLMAPLVSGGALAISDSKPPVYLLNNTDHNYYFYDWDYDNRPEGAGVARGHQYNGITNQTDCEACAGGQWDDGDAECWAVYWVECNGTTWSLSTVSQYNITTNSGRFRKVTDVLTPMVITSTLGGLDDLDDFDIEYTNPTVGLSASITGSFEYIPAYHQYDFTEVTNPDATDPEERFTEYTYYYYNGETYTSAPSASISSGATPSVTYYWSIYGAGADYLSFSNEGTTYQHTSNINTPTLYYREPNNGGHKTATLSLTVTYVDGSTQTKTATITVKSPCQNPSFSANVTYDRVIISWTPTAESYVVSWKKDAEGTTWVSQPVGDVTTYPITGLEDATRYYYKVKADCTPATDDPTPSTFTTKPEQFVRGAVFGGGRMANVGGNTEVVIINTDHISAVYGGNDIAGEVLGAEGSTVVLGVNSGTAGDGSYATTYNNCAASTMVNVGDVYGGGNGFYLYDDEATGFEGATTSSVTIYDNHSIKDLENHVVWTNTTGSDYNMSIPTIVKTDITMNTDVVKADSIFGGAKNAFITNSNLFVDGTSITVDGGTAFAVFGGNNYGGTQTAGRHHIAITNTKVITSGYPSGLGRNFGIGYVFGGGNKVAGKTTNIFITGGMCDTVFGGGNAADVDTAKVQINCSIDSGSGCIFGKTYSYAISSYSEGTLTVKGPDDYGWDGTGIYNVRTLFGGNNRANMAGLPTLTLTSGSVGTVYGGGNAGHMLAQFPDDEDPEHHPGTGPLALDFDPPVLKDGNNEIPQPIYYGTHVVMEEDNMLVDYLYGGCQMSDVLYSTWTEIKGGHVGTVYGGCNISGDVGSEPRRDYYDGMPEDEYQLVNGGTYVKASGGTIHGSLFAGSNGYYHCNDGVYYIEGAINLGHYIGDTIPTHNETHVMVSGDVIVNGDVYAGGNLAYVGFINETDQGYRFRDFVGFCSVRMTGGKVIGNVYGGGNRASIFGNNEVKVSGGSIGYDLEGTPTGGALYGGNDHSGQVAQITNRVLPNSYGVASDRHTDLRLMGVKTYVSLTGKPKVGTVYGGGNGAYPYTADEYCDVTDKPVQSNTFVDIGIDAQTVGEEEGGYINEVYGGGNGVTVLDRITVFVNVENMPTGEGAYDQVGTIFGGNNLGDLDILSDIIVLNGQINTIYGGCNKGAMVGSLPYNGFLNLGSMVHLRDVYSPNGIGEPVPTNAKVTHAVYGGCRMNGVAHNTLVLIEAGEHTATIFGGSDISGNVADTTQVIVTGGTVGAVYGGGNGNYDYISGPYAGLSAPFCDSTRVEMRGGSCLGNVFGGGYAGECGDTYLRVENCAIGGGIYGGGNEAGVIIDADNYDTGSTTIEMTGGSVATGVYGGCNVRGNIEGDVAINITGGTIGIDDTHVAEIHGGGYGDPTNVAGNIDIQFGAVAYSSGENPVEIHNEYPKLYGDLYGGSALGDVNTNSHTNSSVLTHTNINIDNGTIHGDVYGGGLGYKDENPQYDVAAMVYGEVNVSVGGIDNEGRFFGKASFKGRPIENTNKGSHIFGANNLNGTPKSYVHVDVYQTDHTDKDLYDYFGDDRKYAIYQVFGGGNKANYDYVEGSTIESYVHIHGCENTIEDVFGGSNAAHSISASTVVEGGRFDYIFGGGNGIVSEAKVGIAAPNRTYSQVQGGHVGWCFGGSNRLGNCIRIDQDLVSGGHCGELVIEYLFQGGNQADQYGELELNFTCEANESYLAAYGGCRLGTVYGNITVNMTGGSLGSLYGGCQGSDGWPADVKRCPTQQEVLDHPGNYTTELKEFLEGNTDWYGRGGNITVIVKGGAIGNLFGGCETNGNVDGKITVIVEEEGNSCGLFVGNVYGAGHLTDYTPEDPTIASPKVNIIKGTIGGSYDFNQDGVIQANEIYAGNVFGGSNVGIITCNPIVNIGDGTNDKPVTIKGSVFGGGNEGNVNGSPQVFVVPDTHTLTVNPPQISNVSPPQNGGGSLVIGTHTTSGEDFQVGENVDISITAIPAPATSAGGYLFQGWTIDEDGTEAGASVGHPSNANTTFTMGTDAAELTASFLSVPSHKLVLEANPSAGGTFKVNGVAYNPAEDYYVAQGATVTVEAINQTGYVFHHWVADGASVSSTLTAVTTFVVGNSNVTLTAHFDPTLTLTVDPANTGTLKVNDENYTRPVSIPSGTEVTVTAIPEAGYRFVNWTNGETVVSTDASYTFTSTGVPVSLTAHFAQSGRRTNHNRR